MKDFHDRLIEPKALCGNCDSHAPTDRGQICCNSRSIHHNTVTTEENGCNQFFPDPARWPDADHD